MLHLVDERAIREEFVPKLLEWRDKPTALDRVLDDAPALWKTLRNALAEEDAEAAASSLVCQLALKFSACCLPHQ